MAKIFYSVYGIGEVEVPDDYDTEDVHEAILADAELEWHLIEEDKNDN